MVVRLFVMDWFGEDGIIGEDIVCIFWVFIEVGVDLIDVFVG